MPSGCNTATSPAMESSTFLSGLAKKMRGFKRGTKKDKKKSDSTIMRELEISLSGNRVLRRSIKIVLVHATTAAAPLGGKGHSLQHAEGETAVQWTPKLPEPLAPTETSVLVIWQPEVQPEHQQSERQEHQLPEQQQDKQPDQQPLKQPEQQPGEHSAQHPLKETEQHAKGPTETSKPEALEGGGTPELPVEPVQLPTPESVETIVQGGASEHKETDCDDVVAKQVNEEAGTKPADPISKFPPNVFSGPAPVRLDDAAFTVDFGGEEAKPWVLPRFGRNILTPTSRLPPARRPPTRKLDVPGLLAMFEGPGCYMEWGGAHAPADMPKACVECTTPKTEQNVPLPPSSADLGAPTSDAKENSEETSASISFIGDRAAPEAVSHETTTLLPSAPARRILNPSSRLARAGPQLDLKVPLPPSQFEFGVSGSVFDFTVKQQAFQLPPIPSFANPANENLMDLSHCNNEAEGNTERFKLTEYEDIEEKDTGDEDEEEDEEDEVKPDTTTRVYSTVGGPFFAAIEERCPEIRMGDSGAYKAVEEPVTTAQGDNEAAEEAKKKKKKRGGKGRKKNGKGLKGGKGGKGKK